MAESGYDRFEPVPLIRCAGPVAFGSIEGELEALGPGRLRAGRALRDQCKIRNICEPSAVPVTPDASDGPATKIPARAIRERWLILNTRVCPGGPVLRGARIQYPCRRAFLPAPKVHERGF
jgi:hypothetical protein